MVERLIDAASVPTLRADLGVAIGFVQSNTARHRDLFAYVPVDVPNTA